jgi:hypothetical protein
MLSKQYEDKMQSAVESAAEKQRTSQMQQAVSEKRNYMSSRMNSCELFVWSIHCEINIIPNLLIGLDASKH